MVLVVCVTTKVQVQILSAKQGKTIFLVFGMTRAGLEPTPSQSHDRHFVDHRNSSQLFTDDVLLAISSQDLQHVLGRFAASCEAAGMRISISKCEATVLDGEKGGLFLRRI